MNEVPLFKQVYQCDPDGYFVGVTLADQSPLDPPGVYLIPGGCVTVAPPDLSPGWRAKWDGKEWQLEEIPAPPSSPESQPIDWTEMTQRYIDLAIK